jgi:hypothetical protein
MSTNHQAAETAVDMAIKASPPATVSIATLAGYQVSELVLWATLFYTILMICHKTLAIWRDLRRAPACDRCEG